PTGGGSGAPPTVRGHRGADRPAAAGLCLGVRRAVMDKTVCLSSPCVQGTLCGGSSAGERGRSGWWGGSMQRRNRGRRRFFGGKSLRSHLRGLESTVGVVTEARERAIWERSAGGTAPEAQGSRSGQARGRLRRPQGSSQAPADPAVEVGDRLHPAGQL